jgi:hypothetical protein
MESRSRRPRRRVAGSIAAATIGIATLCLAASAAPSSLLVVDYAPMPITGAVNGAGNAAYLARGNFLAEEPGPSLDRLFVNDLNGQLYIVDRATRSSTEYLNFNGRDLAPGLFDRFAYNSGLQSGLVTFEFDPAYATNGKFYTIHTEDPSGVLGSQLPDTTNYPNLDAANFGVTASVDSPGNAVRHSVLLEWTDTNRANATFEGSVRELLRIDAPGEKNPPADIIFNPAASSTDADWRVMYLALGDGGGENSTSAIRRTPQILSALGGKILRIRPDDVDAQLALTASVNGKYFIPNDNPFTSITIGTNAAHVRDEIWATGFRNPQRLNWDVNPLNPAENRLIASDNGIYAWEEVNVVAAGDNFGYALREGNQELVTNTTVDPLPSPDEILDEHICAPPNFSSCTNNGVTTPKYPVLQYGRALDDQDATIAGDSIAGGVVYRGSLVPALYGKYVFGDSTTGRLFYAELAEMLANDDGDPTTMAEIHELELLWDDPNDAPNEGTEPYSTISIPTAPGSDHSVQVRGPMYQIVDTAYHDRGGLDPNLPGAAGITNPFGRADIQLATDAAGELYILSKSDGMIRAIVGPQPEPGDFNFDDVVDAADYTTWKLAYGQPVPHAGWGPDGNGDGVVDAVDYTVWRNLMSGVGSGGLVHQAVPEPTSLSLLIAAAIWPRTRRRPVIAAAN